MSESKRPEAPPRRDGAPPLTEGQARHLRLSLGSLLAEAEDLLRWTKEGSSPDEQWIRDAAVELERLMAAIRQTGTELDLPLRGKPIDPRDRVAAWASMWWASVLDCRPAALKGYGQVHPDTGLAISPHVEEMAELLLRIEALSRSGES